MSLGPTCGTLLMTANDGRVRDFRRSQQPHVRVVARGSLQRPWSVLAVRRRLPWFARLRIRKEPETAYGDYSADQKDGLRRQTNRRRHTREVLLCACGQAPVNHPASVSERVWRVIVTWCMSCAKFKLNCSTATRPSSGQPWPQAKHHNPSAITQYCTIAIPTPTGWVPAPTDRLLL
jgi:hypothetical protein